MRGGSDVPVGRITEQVSQGSDAPNAFWQIYGSTLQTLLHDDVYSLLRTRDPAAFDQRNQLYTRRRLWHPESRAKERLALQVHPCDPALLGGLGEWEAEFLGFFLGGTSPRMLVVRGHVGSGKSTFLRHALWDELPRIHPDASLAPRAVIVNFRIGLSELDWQDIESIVRRELSSVAPPPASDTPSQTRTRGSSSAAARQSLVDYLKWVAKHVSPIWIAYDNVDQLPGDTIARIVQLAFCTHYECGIPTCLVMRPPTYHLQAELTVLNGAYTYYTLTLPAPDLGDLLARRFDYLERLVSQGLMPLPRSVVLAGKSLAVQDPARAVRALAAVPRILLTPDLQDFLYRLSDYQTRMALVVLERILSAHDLPVAPLLGSLLEGALTPPTAVAAPDQTPEPTAAPSESAAPRTPLTRGLRADRMLRSVMCASRRLYYADAVVPNLLEMRPQGRLRRLVGFHALALARMNSGMATTRRLSELLRSLNYDSDDIDAVIRSLLASCLVFSPEVSDQQYVPRNIGVTAKGKYFLDELLMRGTYAFNAVDDCTLPIPEWTGLNQYRYAARAARVLALYEETLTTEETLVMELDDRPDALGLQSLRRIGFLSSKLARAVNDVAGWGQQSTFASTREVGLHLATAVAALSDRQLALPRLVASHTRPEADVTPAQLHADVGYGRTLSVRVPRRVIPGYRDRIELELSNPRRDPYEPEVTVLCTSHDPRVRCVERLARLPVHLAPQAQRNCSIPLELDPQDEELPMPALSLDLHADGRPIGSIRYEPEE